MKYILITVGLMIFASTSATIATRQEMKHKASAYCADQNSSYSRCIERFDPIFN